MILLEIIEKEPEKSGSIILTEGRTCRRPSYFLTIQLFFVQPPGTAERKYFPVHQYHQTASLLLTGWRITVLRFSGLHLRTSLKYISW